MINDKIIEEVIKVLYNDKSIPLHDVLYKILDPSKDNDGGKSFLVAKNRLREILVDEKIIEKTTPTRTELTHFAKTIFESGGWLKHVNETNKSLKLKQSKEEFDYQISKYLAKTKWWPLGISIISLIISLLQLKTCSTQSTTIDKSQKPIIPKEEGQTKMDSSKYKLMLENDSLNLKL
jgi:hypothetical protein